jgi:hypothetical protein
MSGSNLVKKIVLLAFCSSIIFVGKFALVHLPNIEVVTFLLIVFTLVFKLKEVLLISTVYTIVELLIWGVSEQLYIWTVIVLITALFRNVFKENFLLWSILSGFFGITFGLMCALPIYLLTDKTVTIAYLWANIPYDVIHMVSNYMIMLLLGEIVYKKLKQLLAGYYN